MCANSQTANGMNKHELQLISEVEFMFKIPSGINKNPLIVPSQIGLVLSEIVNDKRL